ncbi:unnamed protein product [Mesocestoides corti]|uniref:Protein kinase domain-containing protein n=3 Tax=Mesocestoides corti TaxID=53468 RepID=A0A0R3UF75_MESCO|nr:unnamed protein product [Mesocestoides corti]
MRQFPRRCGRNCQLIALTHMLVHVLAQGHQPVYSMRRSSPQFRVGTMPYGCPLLPLVILCFAPSCSVLRPPPFKLNGLVFNVSDSLEENTRVNLRCEYYLKPPPAFGFKMIISFLPKAKMPSAVYDAAISTDFIFPDVLQMAHKGTSLKSLLAAVAVVALLASFCLGIWLTRPRKVIFKRVVIERSLLYSTETPNGLPDHLPKVTLVPEPHPPLGTYLKAFYRHVRTRLSEFDSVPNEPTGIHENGDVDSDINSQGLEGSASIVKVSKNQPLKSQESKSKEHLFTPILRRVSDQVEYLIPVDPTYEIPFSNLEISRNLGQGAFGLVFRGSAVRLPGGVSGPLPVAIKTLYVNSSEDDVVDFVREIEMMKFIGKHENVVQLYATSTCNGRPVMVMEYAAEGSLVNYLRRNRALLSSQPLAKTESTLLSFACQVANGMAYLASKGIVHRDLAARNVVIAADLVAKIADFGLTRKAALYYRMRGTGRVPVKWMAPESIFQMVFTTKSDVWSFGVLLWELFSLGESPAAEVPFNEFVDLLRKGAPIYTKPKYASEDIFVKAIQTCWKRQPENRPTFVSILSTLSAFSESIALES